MEQDQHDGKERRRSREEGRKDGSESPRLLCAAVFMYVEACLWREGSEHPAHQTAQGMPLACLSARLGLDRR